MYFFNQLLLKPKVLIKMLKTNFLRHFGNLINTYFNEKIEIEKKKNSDVI